MQAIRVIHQGEQRQIALSEQPKPVIESKGKALVRVLCVGLDGTDREIITEQYGTPPSGEHELTIGHESLGVVEETDGESGLAPGDLVTALVRRPCHDPDCVNCRNDRSDFCQTGQYVERGIKGAHGFLAEYYVEEPRYLVKVPPEGLHYGVLAEPQSIIEKVWSQLQRIQQRTIWEPKTALILGAGPLGLLAVATCRCLGLETYVWSLDPADSPQAQLVRYLGGHYQQAGTARSGQPANLKSYIQHIVGTRPDLVLECTGYSPLGFEAVDILAPNGVLAFLGVTPGRRMLEMDTNALNQAIVLENKCILGSVNASRKDFETGLYRLGQMQQRFPEFTKRLVTERYRLSDIADLDFKQIRIKAVVDVVPEEQWASLASSASGITYRFSL